MRIRSSARHRTLEEPGDGRGNGPGTGDDRAVPPPRPDGRDTPPPTIPADRQVGERMRQLRAALAGRWAGRPGQPMTLAVAMAGGDRAADLLAADLAVASARLGYEVLLVDANIARPGQHRLFRVANDHGVTDMARWQADIGDGVQPTGIRGLSLLTAGPAVDNPAELIERLGLCDRLRRAAGRFDTILIDATAQPAPTAAAAAQGSDGVLLAVRRGRTPIDAIRRTIASFADRQVESLGLVSIP